MRITESTKRIWVVPEQQWRDVAHDRHEYLVQARLPRHRQWSIGHSKEKEAAEGQGSLGWWLALFSGNLVPVIASPRSWDLS